MTQRINMEIAMTDEHVIRWVHEVLNVGTVVEKRKKGLRKNGTPYLKQWKWRCTFREAYYVCRLLWPHAHTKLHKIEQVIDHYEPYAKNLGDNVIDLELERKTRKFDWNLHGS
jgi:hypothetical protein